MILYLGAGGNHNIFFLGKSDEGSDIYSNFSKIVIEGVGKIWLELFKDIIFFIPLHMFFRSLMFSLKNLVK